LKSNIDLTIYINAELMRKLYRHVHTIMCYSVDYEVELKVSSMMVQDLRSNIGSITWLLLSLICS